jgi:hypothetical protein
MKNILIIVLIVFGINAKAQITLEDTYDSASAYYSPANQLMMINFAISGEQYVNINREGKTIEIYNLNHSLVKSISFAGFPQDVSNQAKFLYISENLFSTDSKIAFIYIYGAVSGFYSTQIYNEDGTILFHADSAGPLVNVTVIQQQYPIFNTSNGTKMIISYASTGQAKIFSLPGTLTSDIEETNKKLMAMQSSVSNAYPNPNTGSAQIDYTLPQGVNEGEIVFYNLQGMEVKRFKVDRTFNTLLISTKDIAAGTYYYQLQTAGESSGGRKMVVIK